MTVDGIVATGLPVPSLAAYDRAMAELVARWRMPGAALALVQDGRVILARGYGYASLEEQLPVQPDSRFRIASASKLLTAAAVLLLAEQQHLDLDRPMLPLLGDLAPAPATLVDPRLATITVRHLLQHAGGWDRRESFEPVWHPTVREQARALGLPEPVSAESLIRVMLARPLDFDPGTRYGYSNLGYCILGRIVERVAGQPYETFVQSRILEPIGITRMQIGASMRDGLAEGEVRYYDPGATTIAPGDPWWQFQAMDASGGWIASAVDLARLLDALGRPDALAGNHAEGRPVLQPGSNPRDGLTRFPLGAESLRLMRARPAPPLWADDAQFYYGLGCQVRELDGRTVWGHDGSLPRTLAEAYADLPGSNGSGGPVEADSPSDNPRPGSLTYAVLFNTLPRDPDECRRDLRQALSRARDAVADWPTHDLSAPRDPGALPASARLSVPTTDGLTHTSSSIAVDLAAEAHQRQQALVEALKAEGSIQSPAVEAAFRAVARHQFIPEVALAEAYANQAIATKRIDNVVVSSTSQPSIMAIMLEMLDLQPGHRVLEIGAGTGYNAALMAEIVGERGLVVAVDIDDDLVEDARAHLATSGHHRVRVIRADGALGAPDAAPFDRIVLTVASTDVSPAWREQLAPRGRLLLPFRIGGILTQKVVLFEAAGDHLETVAVRGGWFIMLRGAHGQEQQNVQMGPAPGLELWADALPTTPPDTLFTWLSGPSQDYPTGVQVTRSEMWGGLLFWLGLHESSLCQIVANPASLDAQRRRWPLRYPTGAFLSTVGLVETVAPNRATGPAEVAESGRTGGLALLAGPPIVPGEPLPADSVEPYEVVVRGYGNADALTHRLVQLVRNWDAAGRRTGAGLRVRAYSTESPPPQTRPGEIVIQKPHTRLVVDWP